MFSHLSQKRGTAEIGRFGLGFKSVLGVTDAPEFFSRSGSFRFDRAKAKKRVQPIVPNAESYPVLRLPEAIDPWPEIESDPVLLELTEWAVNVVRIPLKPGAQDHLNRQIAHFPPEFLLFVQHVSQLVLQTSEQIVAREITLSNHDNLLLLDNGGNMTRWILVKAKHTLSPDAKSDNINLDDTSEVQISWAAPVDRLDEPGKFWAFFPTITASLLSGILNAPWKTNEDRQNLLPGIYNDELIDAAADMVANALSQLSTKDDPARHLDALPRRYESGDTEHSIQLRKQIYSNLKGREVVPNQAGKLQKLLEIQYPPEEITEAGSKASDSLKKWQAHDHRPLKWLHHAALTRFRLAKLDELYAHDSDNPDSRNRLPRETIAKWLEALVENAESEQLAVQASMAAIQTATLIPQTDNAGPRDFGSIVLTADGRWVSSYPDNVFRGGGHISGAHALVHPELETDTDTLDALRNLGIKPASPESAFKDAARRLLNITPGYKELYRRGHKYGADFVWRAMGYMGKRPPINQAEIQIDEDWREFWQLARDANPQAAAKIIKDYADNSWRRHLRVRTIAGNWRSPFQTLLPGPIIPTDSNRDDDIAIDVSFHEADLPLLKDLGVADVPRAEHELSQTHYSSFSSSCKSKFIQSSSAQSTPQRDKLGFYQTTTSGPLDVLKTLSDEGRVLYTSHLLNMDATYEPWTMRHNTRRKMYQPMDFESPAIEALRKYGRVKIDDGIYELSDGLGNPPKNLAVLKNLLSHPKVSSIRRAFDLKESDANTPVEPIGAEDPAYLVDVWPGLKSHLTGHQMNLQLIRCDQFSRAGHAQDQAGRDCTTQGDFVYVTRKDRDIEELQSVVGELGLQLDDNQLDEILRHQTPTDIKAAREEVRRCSTDEERLLAAVGEFELRSRLPEGLIGILEHDQGPLSGVQVAQAAIATFHTGALHEYRHTFGLGQLDPPQRWAGSLKAVEFVRSLGFGEEWAGERNTRRDPFIEVDGPYSLPKLHDYQRRIADNVRTLLRSDGMISQRRRPSSLHAPYTAPTSTSR